LIPVRVSDFHFDLPADLIAQHPPTERGASRMLRVDRATGAWIDDQFRNLPELLSPGDLLILNDSRVLPARLFATRGGLRTQHNSPDPTGRIEVLLTQQTGPHEWSALVRPGRKVQAGETLNFGDGLLTAEIISAGEYGERTLRFTPDERFFEHLEAIGHMPLPPYIQRDKDEPDSSEDKARYQTVYAANLGSAAAPTAGLHFTPEIIAQLKSRGVQVETITLHVGLGTFQPVRVEHVEDIRLHTEHYTLPPATAQAIQGALKEGRRIIAAGTTTTRTLEHCAATGNLEPHSGSTSIFIRPGHRFRIVSGLLTNFHLPQSTLLMLVSALFASPDHTDLGRHRALAAYAHVIEERYRFFSYGDCMLIL
jgi:S-adenosylmethionine:tRNA ribosyltransferase-isomerase